MVFCHHQGWGLDKETVSKMDICVTDSVRQFYQGGSAVLSPPVYFAIHMSSSPPPLSLVTYRLTMRHIHTLTAQHIIPGVFIYLIACGSNITKDNYRRILSRTSSSSPSSPSIIISTTTTIAFTII